MRATALFNALEERMDIDALQMMYYEELLYLKARLDLVIFNFEKRMKGN